MTTYSQSDLATRVLRDLGLVASDEDPSADDLSFAEETVGSVYAELALRGISLPNGSDTALPAEYLVCVSKRIGLDVGPAFGLFSMADAETAKPIVERTLRALAAKPPTGSRAEAEYF